MEQIATVNKNLIINADDFGVTSGVNRAVMSAHECGVVTSTSIIVNMWAFGEAVEMAKSAPSLGVGLHFALAAGKPVSPPRKVPTLVDHNGLFHSRSSLILRLLIKQVSLDEVRRELYAQNEKLFKAGIKADHINGDKHIHILPGVSRIVASLSGELGGIPIRIPDEQLGVRLKSLIKPKNIRALSALLLRKAWARRLKHHLARDRIASNVGFISLFGLVPRRIPSIQDFQQLISMVKPGVSEFMVHPGNIDEKYIEFFGSEALAKDREVELQLLMSNEFKNILLNNSIHLINYGSIHASNTSL